MPKQATTEDLLAELGQLERCEDRSDIARAVSKLLRHRAAMVVARAARVAANAQLSELTPDLSAAFSALLGKGADADPGCLAKTALIEALNALESTDATPFLEGIGYVQLEPVYGGRVDTAPALRGHCGFGLARMLHPDAHLLLTDLVMDRQVEARRMAVRALAYLGDERSELVLRMKAMAGDEELEVVTEAFSRLAQIAPRSSVPFLARYLDDPEPVIAEGAAIAMGETRTPEAFTVLRDRWERCVLHEEKKQLLLPIALIRSDDAFALLRAALAEEHGSVACAVAEALRLYTSDSAQRAQIEATLDEREEPAIRRAFEAAT